MNPGRFLLSIALMGLLCGCGTINNAVMISYGVPAIRAEKNANPSYVYGGIKFDAKAASFAVSKSDEISPFDRLACALFILDLPLSAVCDTLYLPFAIAADKQTGERRDADIGVDEKETPVALSGSDSDVLIRIKLTARRSVAC